MPQYTPVAMEAQEQSTRESKTYLPTSSNETTPGTGAAWEPGFWKRFPGLAAAAMFVVITMGVCMGIVLYVADGREATWDVSPTVLLAAAAAIANAMGRYALVEGVAISWWKRASSPGTRMEHLHHNYSFGEDLTSVLRYLKAFNFVALASLAVSILPINGVLLQRAITIRSAEIRSTVNMSINFAQQFPNGYTGIATTRTDETNLLTTDFTTIVQDYASGTVQNTSVATCRGRCSGTIQAAGYAIKCRESKASFDISTDALGRLIEGGGNANLIGPALYYSNFVYDRDASNSAFLSDRPKHARMDFSATFKNIDTCVGDLQIRNCTLEPALLRQRVVIENQTLILDPAYNYTSDQVVQSPILVSDKTPAESGSGNVKTTHGGMALYLRNRFNSEAGTNVDGIYGIQIFAVGNGAYMDYMTDAGGMGNDDARCNIKWRDPTPNMMATVRELAFRTAYKAADPNNITNVITMTDGEETRNVLVYKSNFKFLGLALMITFFGLVCILPTFTGFWNLGRRVSMNPLEIAKAFNGVRMQHADSNSNIDMLLKEIGKEPVRYGAVSGNKLMMEDPVVVADIPKGVVFR